MTVDYRDEIRTLNVSELFLMAVRVGCSTLDYLLFNLELSTEENSKPRNGQIPNKLRFYSDSV